MKYALNIDTNNRILSACVVLPNGNYENMTQVDSLPEGKTSDYLYIDGEYVYDPLPASAKPGEEEEPTYEERIAALEEENAMLLECVLEMSEIVYA